MSNSEIRALSLATMVALAGCSQPGDQAPGERSSKSTEQGAEDGAEPVAATIGEAAFAIEEVARYPRPGTAIPHAMAFAPGDREVTFLYSEDGSLVQQLYALDVTTGKRRELVGSDAGGVTEDNLSPAEKLQRERTRSRGLGVTRYAWAREGARMLIPMAGGIAVKDSLDAPLRQVVQTSGAPALNPRFSRDGARIAYVQDGEIYVVSAAGGAPVQITAGARQAGKTHGLAEYIAQEEMGRLQGYWWSWDGAFIAYTEVDERHIPVYRIMHQGKPHTGDEAQEDHRYPFAGASNAVVRLGVVSSGGGGTVWMDLDMEGAPRDPRTGAPDIYLARVHWMPDGRLLAELENRAQTRLDLVELDPRTGARKVLLSETSDAWINLHDMFEPIAKGEHAGGFVWASERTGYMHLYLYDRTGKEIGPITQGEWLVDSVVDVDDEGGKVYFTGTKDGALERHLYVASFTGGEPRRLTPEPGMYHGVVLDHGRTRFVAIHSAVDQPPRITVRNLEDGAVVATIHDQVDPRIESLGLKPPELVTLQSRDGVTLHGALYRPAGKGPFPTLISVYGGPHAQQVSNNWGLSADMRAQYLRSMGFLVFKLDNRGSARRGLAFESAIKNDMGNLEVQDQVDGVNWLVAQGLADPARVGIYGWSYGGYMAAMSLARAPDTFHAAVAGAPVAHWDAYDTSYTERYMGTPQSNPRGYEESSVMHHVPKMRGKLLLVHGLIDENVHFRNTARLINALIEHRKDYDLLLFPNERHMPRSAKDREYMEERVRDFLVEALAAPAPSPAAGQ